MAKTGSFFNSSNDTTDVAAVDQTFNVGRKNTILLNKYLTPSRVGKQFSGKLEGIIVKVKTIAGGAASLTIKGVAGGLTILPDTTATIALDVGSTTVGTVAFYAGLVWQNSDDTLELYYTCDAGTVTVDSAYVSWAE